MRVSVIVAAYNCELAIERAVSSVLDQSKPVTEVIVVDDASTDGTAAVVRAMACADPRIVLIEGRQNRGPAGARNLGLQAATGDWIAVLDADDAWSPDRVQAFADAIDEFDVDVVADNQFLYDSAAEKVTRIGFSPDHGVRWIRTEDVFTQDVQLGAEFSYGILKPFFRRSFLEARGLSYSNSIRYGEDLLFLGELLISGAKALLIPTPHYIYTTRMGDESKVASPHSRSVPRFDLFAVGIEALRSEYEASLSEDVVAAMSRLAGRFRQVHAANLAREERRRRGMFAYALHLACHPPALAQVARQRAAYARRMAGGKLSAVREALAARPARATGGSAGALARLRATGVEFATAFVFAVPLVALATIVRGLLSAQLASRSPYMIYVTAAVAGALLRGSLCGALTAAGGALAGLYFFVEPSWSLSARPEDLAALAMFCFVCASVLFPTAMLRRKTSEQETRSVGGGLSQTGMTRQLDL